jgi:ankyrin repeat protein
VIESGGRRAVQQVVTARGKFSPVEETMVLNYDSPFENIWSLAGSLAAIILNSEGDEPGRWILPDHSKVFPRLTFDEEAHSWLYRLLKAPATVLDSSWITLFQPHLIFRNRFSLLHAAFHMAVWRGNDTIVRAVIRGIINWSEEYYSMEKRYLHRLGIHCESVTPGSFSITALELAAASGHSTIVKLLLDHGPKIPGRVGYGEDLLHMATKRGNEGIVRLLLDHKVDVEARNLKNLTALHLAASTGYQQVLRAIIESGANVNSKTNSDWTPLHLAIAKGYKALAQLRLPESASFKTANGETTLHKAVETGYIVVARLLLDYGADLTAKTSEGWTAIHLAAYYGMTGIIELLLEKGANIEEEAEGGLTALDLAASKGQEKTVWLLLKNGAKATTKALIGSDILIRSRTGLSYP